MLSFKPTFAAQSSIGYMQACLKPRNMTSLDTMLSLHIHWSALHHTLIVHCSLHMTVMCQKTSHLQPGMPAVRCTRQQLSATHQRPLEAGLMSQSHRDHAMMWGQAHKMVLSRLQAWPLQLLSHS